MTCKDPVTFVGVSVNGIFGHGFVLGAGYYTTGKADGLYLQYGWGVGLDLSAGGVGGKSDNLSAFEGHSEGGCAGVAAGNGCVTSNASGTTKSGGLAVGPSEVTVSGHAEISNTKITTPRPLPPPKKQCGPEDGRAVCGF
jgi:hypothetical protein